MRVVEDVSAKRVVDNFELIESFLKFDADLFYWVAIMKRRKEDPKMSCNSECVRNFQIASLEKFQEYKPRIKEVCARNAARAYIYLNRRSYTKVALSVIKLAADYVASGQSHCVRGVYDKACGVTNAESEKVWLIDVDQKDTVFGVPTTVHLTVPTLNGYHLIVEPFDTRDYKSTHTLFRDQPTLLYFEEP